jgi:hypothetical protein
MGQNLWNAPLFHLVKIHELDDNLNLELGICDYFQYVSACGPIEQETIKATQFEKASTPLRNRFAPNLDKLAQCPMGAHGIGVHSVVAFRNNTSYEILLQRRTHDTFGYGGVIAVVPSFLYQPLQNPSEEVSLFHNFLREFYEELYNKEEVVKNSTHVSFDWFYDDKPIARLLDLYKSGVFTLEFTGFGFDALFGDVNIALLACIEETESIEREYRQFRSNWEAKGIDRLDYQLPLLAEYLKDRRLHPGSAFALSKAVERLNKLKK